MITKFDSSYYGTADMEYLGYAGTPINERRYAKEQLAKAMHKVVAFAKCMDERGYNTFWMAEHHFQPEGTEVVGGKTARFISELAGNRNPAEAFQDQYQLVLRELEARRGVLGDFELNAAFRFGGVPYEIAEKGLKLFAKEVLPVLKSWQAQSTALAAE